MTKAQGIGRADVRFTRREVRETLGIGNTQVHLHMERLVDLEYVIVRRDGPGGKNFFELAYDTAPNDSAPHLPGLIDVEMLAERRGTVTAVENHD